jgi:3-oxoadipate enol-lactonase
MPVLDRPDGARLYHEIHGEAGRPTVVLMEGYGGDIPGWGSTIEHLSKEFHVLAHDFRGSGRSLGPDATATLSTFVDDTLAIMDQVGIDRAHVYGQSFGGMVAQELALAQSDRVRSLVLGATHCGGPKRRLGRIRVPKDRPYLALFSEGFALEHPERVEAHRELVARSPQTLEAARPQYQAMQAFDVCDRLAGLRLPVLILHGSEDRLVPSANAHLLAERIPGARVVLLPGAGHLYHWEQPEEADRVVEAFVLEVEAEAT